MFRTKTMFLPPCQETQAAEAAAAGFKSGARTRVNIRLAALAGDIHGSMPQCYCMTEREPQLKTGNRNQLWVRIPDPNPWYLIWVASRNPGLHLNNTTALHHTASSLVGCQHALGAAGVWGESTEQSIADQNQHAISCRCIQGPSSLLD